MLSPFSILFNITKIIEANLKLRTFGAKFEFVNNLAIRGGTNTRVNHVGKTWDKSLENIKENRENLWEKQEKLKTRGI